ncbi:PREDICTED: heparanase [Prunus dulcis]|uniref:PREDICTED: heparanase n=1 Tax=Prunus dulcis TaxID=3755 RepID=A0A5E4G5D8_PRUDU|nr:heparanase-like protein 1 [Prunus dulcis]XP_034215014.1 heparanase-like protein 1 [Prunus dulcis]VVA34923.1 PREDICTED: heparanase [Prunus dulcis]VVA34924.1 PREDICTED: heparanase [Prunus dulcis]VVA34925.1 PREDICTED: heparanase [Prunus dulcis]VVA34926.1 PREDICTED: heparanase [Prunus dulcis]VVA34927.1 PREDICTED: heparanase [Prunus dulcis]
MEFRLSLVLILVSLPAILAQDVGNTKKAGNVKVVVNGILAIARVDNNFICATIDWWNHEKCDYNQCPWGSASALNLNLSHPLLAKSIQAFNQLRIRIGGSLEDQLLYDVGNLKYPCHPFRKKSHGLFGFSRGCLPMSRWDELNQFFSKTRPIVTFSLNALSGRHHKSGGVWVGDWDSSNAYDFINYTVSKGYQIDSWEFGNELSGRGVGASVGAEQYGKDLIKLKHIINQLYNKSRTKPALVAPGGFYDQGWFAKLLQVSGSGIVNVITQHMYNLGAGVDPKLVSRILNPGYLDLASGTFHDLEQTVKKNGPWASIWVGESGGAYNSGGRNVSDTFVDSFWYLDQLGMSAKYNTRVYCRQSLVGGNYGLLNRTSFVPNPDYYSALLWHRLMGQGVLAVNSNASADLRIYAHCARGRAGITVVLINFSNDTDFIVNVENILDFNLGAHERNISKESYFKRSLKKTVSWVGRKALDKPVYREEYHLTPKNRNLRSKTMVLNGAPLEITKDGNIPELEPAHVLANSPLTISPLSIKFVVLPYFDAHYACA